MCDEEYTQTAQPSPCSPKADPGPAHFCQTCSVTPLLGRYERSFGRTAGRERHAGRRVSPSTSAVLPFFFLQPASEPSQRCSPRRAPQRGCYDVVPGNGIAAGANAGAPGSDHEPRRRKEWTLHGNFGDGQAGSCVRREGWGRVRVTGVCVLFDIDRHVGWWVNPGSSRACALPRVCEFRSRKPAKGVTSLSGQKCIAVAHVHAYLVPGACVFSPATAGEKNYSLASQPRS